MSLSCSPSENKKTSASTSSTDGEVASLFDSANSEDEEDEEDESSLPELKEDEEEIVNYMDETNNRRDVENEQASNYCDDYGDLTDDESLASQRKSIAVSIVPPVLPPQSSAILTISSSAQQQQQQQQQRRRNLSPPRQDGLEFDMNQPWERSLLRQLEKIEQQNLNNITRDIDCDLVMLGHTESRDFACELDHEDAVSLSTNASSTVPVNPQYIHRSDGWNIQPRVVYQSSSDYDDYNSSYERNHSGRVTINDGNSNEQHYNAHSTANVDNKEGRDETATLPKVIKNIPDTLPKTSSQQRKDRIGDHNNKKKQQQQHQHRHNFEMITTSTADDDYANATIAQDPACFCLGYNMWDYMLPPQEYTTTMDNNNKYSNKKFRNNRTRLSRVEEEETILSPVDDIFEPDHDKCSRQQQDEHRITTTTNNNINVSQQPC